jgi:hypothetical protein
MSIETIDRIRILAGSRGGRFAKAVALCFALVGSAASVPAFAQGFVGYDRSGTPMCDSGYGLAPCGIVSQPNDHPAVVVIPSPSPGGGGMQDWEARRYLNIVQGGGLPNDGQIVMAIARECRGQVPCIVGAWGAVEIQRCRAGVGTPGGCFGPNGEIMRVVNRVLPQHLQPNVILRNVDSDLRTGPGRNNEVVGCNGFVNRKLFGGHC